MSRETNVIEDYLDISRYLYIETKAVLEHQILLSEKDALQGEGDFVYQIPSDEIAAVNFTRQDIEIKTKQGSWIKVTGYYI